MNCSELRELVATNPDRYLPRKVRRRIDRHTRVCPSCRRLCDLLGGMQAVRGRAESEALTHDILRRTSGPACMAAQQRFTAMSRGNLDRREAQLVRFHLDGCPDCRSQYRGWRSTVASARRGNISGLQRLLLRPFADWQVAYTTALLIFLLAAPSAYPRYPRIEQGGTALQPASYQRLSVAPQAAASHLQLYRAGLESSFARTSLHVAEGCRALLHMATVVSSWAVDFTVSRFKVIAGVRARTLRSLENLWSIMAP